MPPNFSPTTTITSPLSNIFPPENIYQISSFKNLNEILKVVSPLEEVDLEKSLSKEIDTPLICSSYKDFKNQNLCPKKEIDISDTTIATENLDPVSQIISCPQEKDGKTNYIKYIIFYQNNNPSLVCHLPESISYNKEIYFEYYYQDLDYQGLDYRDLGSELYPSYVYLKNQPSPILIAKIGDNPSYSPDKVYLIFNNYLSKPYDDIKFLKISPDHKHLAFAVKEGENWYMILDGKRYGPYSMFWPDYSSSDNYEITSDNYEINYNRHASDFFEFRDHFFVPNDIVFSPNSKYFAYFLTKNDEKYLIINNTPFLLDKKDIDFHKGGAIIFSPDSQKLALVVENLSEGDNYYYILAEDYILGPFREDIGFYGLIKFTPDSQYLVSFYQNYRNEKGEAPVFFNGQEVKKIPLSNFSKPSCFIYLATRGNSNYYLFYQGNPQSKDFQIIQTDLSSKYPDKVTYLKENRDDKVFPIILNEKVIDVLDLSPLGDDFDGSLFYLHEIEDYYPILSRDGQVLAYQLIKDNNIIIKVNDHEIKFPPSEYSWIKLDPEDHAEILLSPKGEKGVAFVILDSSENNNIPCAFYLFDTKSPFNSKLILCPSNSPLGPLTLIGFSPDAQYFVYFLTKTDFQGEKMSLSLMLNDKEIDTFDYILRYVRFSQDGKRLSIIGWQDGIIKKIEYDLGSLKN
ncbi:MAG: hypothetical protein ACPLXL_02015 [Minisyncoccia bacterium]